MERLIPQQVDIETSAVCNLRCKLCPTLKEDSPVGLMDYDYWLSIINRISAEPELGNVTVVNWLNGEPLLHPRYGDMCQVLNEKKIKYYVTTNGTILRSDVFVLLTNPDSTAYQIIFSLDGLPDPKSKSIELARPGSDRKQILNNIHAFLHLKIARGSSIDVAVKICERGQDYEEIEEYIQYWLQVPGINYVCVGKELSTINEKSMRIYPCQYSDNKFMVIRYDGLLVACAYNHEAHNNGMLNFGYLDKTTPLVDVYNNHAYTAFREDQRAGIFHQPCDTCGFSYTGGGMRGTVEFRSGVLSGKKIFYKKDHYNSFFSRTDTRKPDAYYKPTVKRK